MSPSRLAADGVRARVGGVWTREKLVYLQKYSAAFMTAMAPKRQQGKWERLVFIDPLCGQAERNQRDGPTHSLSGHHVHILGSEHEREHEPRSENREA